MNQLRGKTLVSVGWVHPIARERLGVELRRAAEKLPSDVESRGVAAA